MLDFGIEPPCQGIEAAGFFVGFFNHYALVFKRFYLCLDIFRKTVEIVDFFLCEPEDGHIPLDGAYLGVERVGGGF